MFTYFSDKQTINVIVVLKG